MKIILFLVVVLYMYSCTNKNIALNNEENTMFINYNDTNIIIDDSLFSNVVTFSPIENKDNYIISRGDLYNFLIENDFINGWYSPFNKETYATRNDYILSLKSDSIIYRDLGIYKTLNSFKSHLISREYFFKSERQNVYQRLTYMMNICKSKLSSIVVISSYFDTNPLWSDKAGYTHILEDGTFEYFEKTLSSDCIICDENGNIIPEKPTKIMKYQLDTNGYLTDLILFDE